MVTVVVITAGSFIMVDCDDWTWPASQQLVRRSVDDKTRCITRTSDPQSSAASSANRQLNQSLWLVGPHSARNLKTTIFLYVFRNARLSHRGRRRACESACCLRRTVWHLQACTVAAPVQRGRSHDSVTFKKQICFDLVPRIIALTLAAVRA